jgi:hypothetical protein
LRMMKGQSREDYNGVADRAGDILAARCADSVC